MSTPIQNSLNLPRDVWQHIFSNLDKQSLMHMDRVCKLWKTYAASAWQPFCLSDWPDAEPKVATDNWKDHYIKQCRLQRIISSNIQKGNAKDCTIPVGREIEALCMHTSKLFSATNTGVVQVWDTQTHQCIQTLQEPGKIHSMCVSEGRIFTGSDQAIRVWQVETGTLLQTLSVPNSKVYAMCASAGKLFSGCSDGKIHIWEHSTNKPPQTLQRNHKIIFSLCAVGGKLFSGGDKGGIEAWDLTTGIFAFELKIDHFDFSPIYSFYTCKGMLFSGSHSGKIYVWNIETCKHIKTLEGHKNTVSSISMIADKLFSCSQVDHTVRVWDVKTWAFLHVFESANKAQSLCSNSHKLFIRQENQSIRSWDFTIPPLPPREWKILIFLKWVYPFGK